MRNPPLVLVRTYRGSQAQTARSFGKDAADLANEGYFPTSQTWAPGSYGCGAFLVALLLCIFLIGILIFIYMLLVKPPGTLSATYQLSPEAVRLRQAPPPPPASAATSVPDDSPKTFKSQLNQLLVGLAIGLAVVLVILLNLPRPAPPAVNFEQAPVQDATAPVIPAVDTVTVPVAAPTVGVLRPNLRPGEASRTRP
jgi:hypothetical protein